MAESTIVSTPPHPRRFRTSAPVCAVALAGMVTSLLLPASCKSPPPEPPLRPVTLGLSWVHQAQFSGPYFADRNGLYAREGLKVEFVPASAEKDPLDEFIAGKYDFVIAQPDTLITARARGHQVKAIAVTYHVHPLVFMALATSGIRRPQDFRGKKVGVAYSEKLLLLALLRKMQIDPGEVTVVQRPYDFASLQSGDLDVQAGWLTDELQTARRNGLALEVVSPYDYGITFYADVLTVRESLIESDPALIERFLSATLRGWTEALQAPEESARLPLHYNRALDPVHEVNVLRASGPLIHTGVDQIGWMRIEDWQGMIRTMHEEGMIAEELAAADVFTTRFLEAVQLR
jgi:ABC-type nitrate/sulfonate/bicarbonate transport system substrate-binding protein